MAGKEDAAEKEGDEDKEGIVVSSTGEIVFGVVDDDDDDDDDDDKDESMAPRRPPGPR